MPYIEVVFVSPMDRTCQTAYQVFKEHPNFENIKFVLVPDLKEHLKCTCDIPGSFESLIKNYSSLFPNFDTFLVDSI